MEKALQDLPNARELTRRQAASQPRTNNNKVATLSIVDTASPADCIGIM